MNEVKAKNKSVERLVNAVAELEAAMDGLIDDFHGRYEGGYHWRAVQGAKTGIKQLTNQALLAVSQAIPEDRIYAARAAGSDMKDYGTATKFRRIETDPDVKIERCADCPGNPIIKPKAKTSMRRFTKSTKKQPTAKEQAAPRVKEAPKVEPKIEPVEETPEVIEPTNNPFPDVEAVLKSFDNDVDMMKAYCQKEGIEIGRRSKAESIAECIVEFHAE